MHTPDQLLRTLMETIPDRIYFKDLESRFIAVNRAMIEFMGVKTETDIFGKTDHDFFLPYHANSALADERQVMQTGESLVAKVEEEVKPDGRTTWVSTTKIPMRNEKGEIIGTCGISRDITAEHQFQALVIQKEKDALLDSLVGGIAHELNNKVLPLLGFTELLMDETGENFDQEKIRRYGSIIKRSSLECAAIVRQLLELHRPASNKSIDCDLRAVTKEAIAFLMFQFRSSNVTVEEHYPEKEALVHCDPGQITQIIINLCLNAVEAMHGCDTRKLDVYVILQNEKTVVQIRDTGVGIPSELLPRIFDPFFTTKQVETARGLGLTVSRSIAHQYKGEISAQTIPNSGSVFSLYLPHQKSASPALAPKPRSATPSSVTATKTIRRVLLVDDEEPIGTLMEEILQRKMRMLVHRAANGEEAIDRLKIHNYDLVISDIRMPVKSGIDLLRWLQENKPAQIKRFFFITGDEGSPGNREIIARANIPILNKPFPIITLINFCTEIMKIPVD